MVVDRLRETRSGSPQPAGETAQVAQRQLAAPGTILLSAATQRLVQEDVWIEPGEVRIGAAHAPVLVQCRGIARSFRGSSATVRGRAVPSWGGRESWRCRRAFRRGSGGTGQVVAVVGDPGMGRSRLLAEYHRSLVEREVRHVEDTVWPTAVPHRIAADGPRAPALCDNHRRAI